MSEQILSAWDALEHEWHYLGRRMVDGFDIATLVPEPGQRVSSDRSPAEPKAVGSGREALAFAFTDALSAHEFLAAAPAGIELLTVAAGDLRAKEEWLRALIDQGTRSLVFDPRPDSLHSAPNSSAAIAVHTALGYILSHRRASACL